MKVQIRNKSNKPRSAEAMQELKDFAIEVAKKLKIENKIDVLSLNYTKNFYGYYPKGKPMFGFKKLYNNRRARIDMTRHWDTSQEARKESIIHELTHIKQMADRRLVISKDCKNVFWNGKRNNSWRKWRFKMADKLKGERKSDYTKKLLPWEAEVQKNLDKFLS